jgi:hypothetical protein
MKALSRSHAFEARGLVLVLRPRAGDAPAEPVAEPPAEPAMRLTTRLAAATRGPLDEIAAREILPTYVTARLMRARYFLMQGRAREAIEACDAALALDPSSRGARELRRAAEQTSESAPDSGSGR